MAVTTIEPNNKLIRFTQDNNAMKEDPGLGGDRGRLMRYKPKSIAALHVALGGLPDKMRVEVDPGIQPSPKNVGELRKMTAWPENLAVTTPQQRDPDSAVKVSKANVATRTTPKS